MSLPRAKGQAILIGSSNGTSIANVILYPRLNCIILPTGTLDDAVSMA